MGPEAEVIAVGLERLPVNPDEPQRVYWSCDLASEDQGLLENFRVWVATDDLPRLPRPDGAADLWVEAQIDDLVQRDFGTLAELSPVQLRP